MGEFEITGPDRNAFVQRVTCSDVGALKPGQAQYSGILTKDGTFVDDCLVYRFEDKLMMVVNASNIQKDWEHIVAQKGGANVRLRDISDETALLAVQGPKAEALVGQLTSIGVAMIPYYHFSQGKVAGVKRRLVGFKVTEPKTVARPGFAVFLDGAQVDIVRSGTVTPTVNAAIGTTYVPADRARTGTKIEIDVRGKRATAETVKMPF